MKELVDSLPSTFTTEISRAHGVHPRDLYAWRDDGLIIELSRGVFRRADAPPASYPDLIDVAHRVPHAIMCCVSAAAIHDLTDEMPASVQIAVPKRSHTPLCTVTWWHQVRGPRCCWTMRKRWARSAPCVLPLTSPAPDEPANKR